MINPKGQNELTYISLKKFEFVLEDIKSKGYSKFCPVIGMDFITSENCMVCQNAFPKTQNRFKNQCPCYAGYRTSYLIRRIKEILKTGKI